MKFLGLGLGLLLLSGCSSYGVIKNVQKTEAPSDQSYSIATVTAAKSGGEMGLMLAFSGGGTRAAALAYGVMQELRDTPVEIDGRPRSMLDEVDVISSVSGGSFTSAYYGLFGNGIFDDYEERFLRRDLQLELLHGLLNPLRWFGRTGRTEMAIGKYEKEIFRNKTFADMRAQDGPLILINASDLAYGVRFSFVQDYFNFLCSDLSSFPVARAVTASSAVPVLFNPVVVKNYPGCEQYRDRFLNLVSNVDRGNPEIEAVIDGLATYHQKGRREYAHFVDGGITDNLGLRAIYEVLEVTGGWQAYLKRQDRVPPRRMVVLSIDASTTPEPTMDRSAKQPGLEETISAISSVQLHLYNAATLELMDQSVEKWAREVSTPRRPVEPYFIRIGFDDVKEPERQDYFNSIPTSFKLTDEQVDSLIAAGRELLRNNPDFQRLLASLRGDHVAVR